MTCGCGHEIPVVIALRAKTTGKNLVCTVCGARGKPIERCGGCENCDGEGFCDINSESYKRWQEFYRDREDKARSLYSDWMDQTF